MGNQVSTLGTATYEGMFMEIGSPGCLLITLERLLSVIRRIVLFISLWDLTISQRETFISSVHITQMKTDGQL